MKPMPPRSTSILATLLALTVTLSTAVPVPVEAASSSASAAAKKAALLKKRKAWAAIKAKRLARAKAAAAAKRKAQNSAASDALAEETTENTEATTTTATTSRSSSSSLLSDGSDQGSSASREELAMLSSTKSSGGFVDTGSGISEPLTHTSSSSGNNPYALRIAAGPKAFGRMLRWNDDIFQRMVGYTVAPAFALGVTADWYPLAHFTTGAITNLGLTASFDMAVGLGTKGIDQVYPTQSSGYDLGLQYRLPFDGFTLGAGLGLGAQSFAVTFNGTRDALPPDVAYNYFRGGLFSSIPLGSKFEFHLHADYLLVRSSGMLSSADFFPRASVAGLDVGGGLDFNFSRAFGVGISGGLRHFFMNMHSQPGDANVAGGATDQYPVGQFKIIYRL